MKKFLPALAVFLVPSVVLAAPRTFQELANLIVTILDTGAGLLILAAVVAYFWGIVVGIKKAKDEGSQVLKNYFIWGIVALFVMVSIWGIVRLLQNTIFGGGDYYGSSGSSQDAAPSQGNNFSAPTFRE